MNIEDKRREYNNLQSKLDFYSKKRDHIHVKQGHIFCEGNLCCNYCVEDLTLDFIEKEILYIKEAISDLERDVDTWTYTIMGNKQAQDLWDELFLFILHYKTDEEYEKYPCDIPQHLIRELINRCYDDLLEVVSEKKSRLAFQVLGVILMEFGAKMSEVVRKLILSNSEWENERNQIIKKMDIVERKNYLFDFRGKIKNYKSGIRIEIPSESINDILNSKKVKNQFTFLDRDSIDYRIL